MNKSSELAKLLHLLGPYLPTDRFRALLRGEQLPETSQGAAMVVDFSGFTGLTERLSRESPDRAGEQLKRMINPIFEAIAGLVFIHGGSVIRFTGDGFTAWFDDSIVQIDADIPAQDRLPGLIRAAVTALEMQTTMRIFNSLRLKVAIGAGSVQRWVVGNPARGLNDLLAGEAVEYALRVIGECQPGQAVLYQTAIPDVLENGFGLEINESGSGVLKDAPPTIVQRSRAYRWPPWQADIDQSSVLDEARLYVPANIREQIQLGLGDYVGELRPVLPMFIQFEVQPHGVSTKKSVLDSYFSSIQEILSAAGGWLVSIEIGDKGTVVYAVFGAPITYGDDAVRALTAAIELRELAKDNPIVVNQRIGMSRGLLFSGVVGGQVRHEYSSIGDETNIAARMMMAAAPGQVLVSAAIRKETSGRFNFSTASEIKVKGREEAISVSILQNVRLVTHARIAAISLTGRAVETAWIEKCLTEARQGFARIIRLEGTAGIGKSRLVIEALEIARQLGFRAEAGDCLSVGEKLPYLPYRSLLTTLFKLGDDDDGTVRLERLHDLVESLEPGWMPRLPLLGKMLDLDIPDTAPTAALDSRRRNQAQIAFIVDLLFAMAAREPLLLVLEDVQWIDELSQLLTFELARRLSVTPARMCILMTHRVTSGTAGDGEYLAALEQGLADLRIQTVIQLSELARSEVFMMITNYLNAPVPEAVANYVYDLARGNPFFIKELVDALLQAKRMIVRGSFIRLVPDWEQMKLPQTIQELVQSRADRLDEVDKLVLKTAAAIGMEFDVDLLTQSLSVKMARGDVLQVIQRLIALDLVQAGARRPTAENAGHDGLFTFRHAITQEVVYQSLPFSQREQLHAAIARALRQSSEKQGVREPVEKLAYHYARAQDFVQAYTYSMQAGVLAAQAYANQSALDYYTQAEKFAVSQRQQFAAIHGRITLMLALGDTRSADRELPIAQQLASFITGSATAATMAILRATLAAQTSNWMEAVASAQLALTAAREAADDHLQWEALRHLRSAYLHLHLTDEAEALDRDMQTLAERLQNERYHLQLLLAWLQTGVISEITPFLHHAQTILDQARALGDPVLEAEYWAVIGNAQFHAMEFAAAVTSYQQQLILARQIADKRMEGMAIVCSGAALVHLGQTGEAHRQLLSGYAIVREVGERATEAFSLLHIGLVSINHRAFDEGLAYMHRSLAIYRALGVRADVALTLFHIATCHIMHGRADQATIALDEAEQIFVASDMLTRLDEVRLARAENAWRNSEPDAARQFLEQAAPRFLMLMPDSTLNTALNTMLDGAMLHGLAYWRLVTVSDRIGLDSLYAPARAAMLNALRIMLGRIPTEQGKQDYLVNLWYHSEILTSADMKALQME